MNRTMTTPKAPRELTGKMVLICCVAFFGVVATVNAIMVRAAVSTFAGTETGSSYRAGLAYKGEEAAAAAQAALNWQVEGRLARSSSGEAILTVDVKDQTQASVQGIDIAARLAHPLNAQRDHEIALTRTAAGSFRGTTDATAGQWTLMLDVTRNGDRVYRSKSRVVLK